MSCFPPKGVKFTRSSLPVDPDINILFSSSNIEVKLFGNGDAFGRSCRWAMAVYYLEVAKGEGKFEPICSPVRRT